MTDLAPPVFYALVQARFNTVSLMDKYIQEIQDLLRREGFPHFDTRIFKQIQLLRTHEGLGADDNNPKLISAQQWYLTNAERNSGFIINRDSVSFQTTCYQTREEFLHRLLEGLKVIDKVVHLEFVTRLGMRYLDAIQPINDQPTEEYISPGIHGVDLPWALQRSSFESRYTTEGGPLFNNGTLVARINYLSGALAFPPDLQLHNIHVNPRFSKKFDRYAVLDTDHSSGGQAPLDYDKLDKEFRHLHSHIREVFNSVTTEHARKIWGL
ncbi:TIGR04255 family protein [Microbulbifer discodermiae]|uniref:TIGR04255 family protein n=1 Tax=Microbulbifer sp. 2201CG32-9 TaxID=3232309 RepID=UPI00345C46B5